MSNTTVKNVARVIGTGIVFLWALGLGYSTRRRSDADYYGIAYYSDAIRAVNGSGMLSSDKNKIITQLKRNENSDFYEAIISVAKSDMLSSDKVETIIAMNAD